VTDWVAATFQNDDPCPCWKTDDNSERRGEREHVEQHCFDREHDRAKRPGEQDQGEEQAEREHVREAAEQGVHEVAVDRCDAGQRAAAALERGVGAVDDRLDPGSGPVDRGERLDQRVGATVPPAGRARPDDSGHPAQLRRDLLTVHAYSMQDAYIYGFALQEMDMSSESAEDFAAEAQRQMREYQAVLSDYPHHAEVVGGHIATVGYDYTTEFLFGIDLILDSLDKLRHT
jgi:hypothetical protein